MKTKFIALVVATGILISSVAFAQLIGTQRIKQNFWFLDDKQIQYGNKPDAVCEYDTAQTNDALVCGLSADSRSLILSEYADMNTNWTKGIATNPTLYIQSSDATGVNKFISFTHNGTNGVIDVGTGSVSFIDPVAFGGGLTGLTGLDLGDGNLTNVGDIALDSISTDNTSGLITLKGAGGAVNNENLIFDFESAANKIVLTSSTGVTLVDFGALSASATGIDLKDSDLTNASKVKVDAIEADATTVDYNDVNILELTQEDVGATCTLGQIKFDTGGVTKELCYCEATDTWVCAALAAGPAD